MKKYVANLRVNSWDFTNIRKDFLFTTNLRCTFRNFLLISFVLFTQPTISVPADTAQDNMIRMQFGPGTEKPEHRAISIFIDLIVSLDASVGRETLVQMFRQRMRMSVSRSNEVINFLLKAQEDRDAEATDSTRKILCPSRNASVTGSRIGVAFNAADDARDAAIKKHVSILKSKLTLDEFTSIRAWSMERSRGAYIGQHDNVKQYEKTPDVEEQKIVRICDTLGFEEEQ